MFSLLKQLQPTLTEVPCHELAHFKCFFAGYGAVAMWHVSFRFPFVQAEFEARFKRLDHDASGVVGSPAESRQPVQQTYPRCDLMAEIEFDEFVRWRRCSDMKVVARLFDLTWH